MLTLGGSSNSSLANSAFKIANSTGGVTAGAGAVLTANVGGRAGRVHAETLVAMGSMTGDSDNNIFP